MAKTESNIGAVFSDVIKSWHNKYVKSDRKICRELSDVGKTRKNRERLLGMMGQQGLLQKSKHLFKCENCDSFFEQYDPEGAAQRKVYGRGRRRGIGLKIDNKMNIVCKFHPSIIWLSKGEIEDIIFGENENTVTPQSFRNVKITRPEEKIPRKCYSIHPHCSICGECHTNARTHDRGHPRR